MLFLTESFYVQNICLRLYGLKLTATQFQDFKIFWFAFISCSLTCVAIMSEGFTHLDSIEKFSEIVAPAIQCIIQIWKGVTFLRQHKTLAKYVTQMRQSTENATPAEERILLEENRRDKLLSGCFCISCWVAGVASVTAPIFIMLTLFVKTGHLTLVTPYQGKFIVDPTNFFNYISIYIISCGSAYFVVNFTTLTDTLLSWFCHNIAARFRILRMQLAETCRDDSVDSKEVEEAVKRCIEGHQEIIAVADDISEIYKSVVFVQYSICSIQLCLIAYQIIQGVAISQLPFLTLFLTAVGLQMMLYSYSGELLKTESEAFALGIYNALCWQNSFIGAKKLLLLAMLRSQRPVILSGIFFQVNWSLFVEVMKKAVSYVTLMKSLSTN